MCLPIAVTNKLGTVYTIVRCPPKGNDVHVGFLGFLVTAEWIENPAATAEEAATVWKQMTEPTYEVVY